MASEPGNGEDPGVAAGLRRMQTRHVPFPQPAHPGNVSTYGAPRLTSGTGAADEITAAWVDTRVHDGAHLESTDAGLVTVVAFARDARSVSPW